MDAVFGLEALEAQRQTTPLGVDLDDLDVDFLARTHDLGGIFHVVLGQLGDVDEAFDPFFDLDEGAERDQLGDLAVHDLVDLAVLEHLLPRVLLGLLETQGDALPVAVDIQHPHLDLLADGEDLGRMVDVAPGELGDVDEAVDAVEVDERAEVDDVGDGAGDQVAHVHAVEDLLARSAALFFEHGPAAEDHVVAEAVELDDPALERLAQELVQIGHPADIDQRGRQEAAHAQVEDETALDHFDDGAGDRGAFFGRLLDALPGTLEPGPFPGEDEPTVGVLFGEHQGVDDVAHRDFFGRIDRLSDGELVGGDDAFALVADVDEDFVLVDPDHGAGDDIPLFESHDRGVVVGNHLPVYLDHQVLAAL